MIDTAAMVVVAAAAFISGFTLALGIVLLVGLLRWLRAEQRSRAMDTGLRNLLTQEGGK